ncbi:hypothetical protein KIN20_004976 [Parelaphostrongylus tenuis]|uniref:EGF-like domain-containing protein n=1 Tax=Parelaphostrongylus tenuis TaxID=148309 RepID=A0AAD5LZB7_PARTN|nr:hypothetical protein KIN20_004976 [Parelaphostrongylus tenuis]
MRTKTQLVFTIRAYVIDSVWIIDQTKFTATAMPVFFSTKSIGIRARTSMNVCRIMVDAIMHAPTLKAALSAHVRTAIVSLRTVARAMNRIEISKKPEQTMQTVTDVNECLVNNGGCSQLCRNEEGGRRCECFGGYVLAKDGKSCIDVITHRKQFDDSIDIDSNSLDLLIDSIEKYPGDSGKRPPSVYSFSFNRFHKACKSGEFGPHCQYTCDDCANGAMCSQDNSSCECPPGFTGVTCDDLCPDGTWGAGCNQICACNGKVCDPVTGNCICDSPDGCPQGPCPPGFYGPMCELKCRMKCPDDRCDPVFGYCACDEGYYGENCDK